MLEETSLARSLLGPGPGSTSTVEKGFREEGIRRNQLSGVFFFGPNFIHKKISTFIQDLLHQNLDQDGITGLVITFLGL